MLSDTFRSNLRSAMRSNRLTGAEISRRAGYSYCYVRKVLAGRQNPTLLFVECMAEAVGEDVARLLQPIEGTN